MNAFEYEISVAANSEAEAEEKMQALTVLAAKLNAKELSKLVHILKHDPIKTALARKYLGLNG